MRLAIDKKDEGKQKQKYVYNHSVHGRKAY